MTEEHIEKLQAYDYTQPQLAVSCEEAKTRYSASTLNFLYGDRSGFEDFAVAREHLYNTMSRINTYHFPALGVTLTGASNESFFEYVVDEAIAEVSYESERLTMIFHADESCLYQADTMDRITATVRGTAEVRLHVKPTEPKAAETGLLSLQTGVHEAVPRPDHVHRRRCPHEYTVHLQREHPHYCAAGRSVLMSNSSSIGHPPDGRF